MLTAADGRRGKMQGRSRPDQTRKASHEEYRTHALLAIALLLTGNAVAQADDVKAGDLVISQAWSRATPGGAKVAGGYLTIENKGTVADKLVGVPPISPARPRFMRWRWRMV